MRVLIAEDEAVSRRLLQSHLRRWGYEVVAAEDGESAWRLLREPDAPTLVILDWEMPGRSGLDVCRALRELPRTPRPYIVLVTAHASTEYVVQGLDAGADDFIGKPYDPRELRVRLRAAERIVSSESGLLAMIRRYRRDLELAQRVQRQAIPDAALLDSMGFSALYVPCDELGGDLFDITPLPGGGCGLFLADVSGHGTQAAMVTMMVRNLYRAAVADDPRPDALLTRVSAGLYGQIPDDMFATALYARFHRNTYEVELSRGGHPAPWRMNGANGQWARLGTLEGGGLLGIFDTWEGPCERVPFHSGDRLLFYTDGLIDARNEAGQMWSEEGLAHALQALSTKNASGMVAGLRAQLDAFRGHQPLDDDLCVVVKAIP